MGRRGDDSAANWSSFAAQARLDDSALMTRQPPAAAFAKFAAGV